MDILRKLQLLFIPCKENKYNPLLFKGKFLVWVILVLFILKIILVSFTFYFPESVFFAEVNKVTLLNLSNQERQSLNINSLTENPKLNEAAYLKAKDMLENDYFAHTSPQGISPWYWFELVGYDYQYAGENLAIDFLDSEELYQAWSSSPSHRANIVNPHYKDIGIAVLSGDFQGKETTVVVELFGSPVETVVPSAEAKTQTKTEETSSISPQKAPTSVPTTSTSQSTGGKSLYSYYLEKGENFPSFSERALLFEKYGLGSASIYKGTVSQNAALLQKLSESEEVKIAEKPIAEEETKEPPKEESLNETTKGEEELAPEEIALLEQAKKESKEPIFPAGQIKGAEIERDSFKFKFLTFMAENYAHITQIIFLVVLTMVIVSLCLDIFIRRTNLQSKDLIFRGVFYTLVLLALFLFDKDIILEMIPHNLGVL